MVSKKPNYKLDQIKLNWVIIIGMGFLMLSNGASAQNPDVIVSVHLRGVIESKVTLLPLSGAKQFKSIAYVQAAKSGELVSLVVSQEYLPGEFILSFENKERPESKPIHSEKRILINEQNLELWVNPVYANNPDSFRFQKDEK